MEILGLIDLPLWTLIIGALIAWFFHHGYSGLDHFKKRGIPTVQPVRPFVGNIWGYWKRDNRRWQLEQVRKYGRVFGVFDGKNPHLYVCDTDVIKSIFVKEFESFTDHRLFSDGLRDEKIIGKFLFVTPGQEWKDIRNAVTPAFSTGKIKKMSRLMEDCCKRMVQDARKHAKSGGDIEIRNMYGRMTVDIIARCAFGTKLDNLDDPDNPFVKHSYEAFRPPLFGSPFAIIPELYPWTQTLFGLEALINRKSIDFFADLVREIIKKRRQEPESGSKRGDFLDVLLEEQRSEEEKQKLDPSFKPVLTEEVLISQCVTFFAAGFDTVGNAMSTATHYLALNPECQDKLLDELRTVVDEHKGEINHETIQECHYLDQVIQETLRICPTDMIIDRGCVRSCEIGGIKFQKGDNVVIPMWSLQHMEENFPNPEKFDPDRFSPENKGKIKPYTYFPFGLGPRICIGMRFATEQAKLAIAHLILNFKVSRCQRTNDPIKFSVNRLVSLPHDMWLKVEEREEE